MSWPSGVRASRSTRLRRRTSGGDRLPPACVTNTVLSSTLTPRTRALRRSVSTSSPTRHFMPRWIRPGPPVNWRHAYGTEAAKRMKCCCTWWRRPRTARPTRRRDPLPVRPPMASCLASSGFGTSCKRCSVCFPRSALRSPSRSPRPRPRGRSACGSLPDTPTKRRSRRQACPRHAGTTPTRRKSPATAGGLTAILCRVTGLNRKPGGRPPCCWEGYC